VKFKIVNPKHSWHFAYAHQTFEVAEGYDPDHPQVPAMTSFGRTWFDIDVIEFIED